MGEMEKGRRVGVAEVAVVQDGSEGRYGRDTEWEAGGCCSSGCGKGRKGGTGRDVRDIEVEAEKYWSSGRGTGS